MTTAPVPTASWTNAAVVEFAGGHDPVDAIVGHTRNVVLAAIDNGWSGPPFDPLGLAALLDIPAVALDDLHDARLVPDADDRLRIEFNPSRPRGRLRFSIAHEIGHSFFPGASEHTHHRTGTGAVPSMASDEWQLELLCNIAAAEIIMPGPVFPVDDLDATPLDIDKVMVLRRRFDVSTEALLRRTAQATTQPISMFAAARDEGDASTFRIDYVVDSRAWKAPLARGMRIASPALAECTAVGHTTKNAESWTDALRDIPIQAVGLPPYPGDTRPRVAGFLRASDEGSEQVRVRYVTGDATKPRGGGRRVIAHLVNNAAHAWSRRGFAASLARAHPEAAAAFRAWTIARPENLRLGEVHVVDGAGDVSVASLVAQEGYGPGNEPRLRYAALREALHLLARSALDRNASVHLPRIGAGQAGGMWPLIAEELDRELCQQGVQVTVYTQPGEHLDLVWSSL